MQSSLHPNRKGSHSWLARYLEIAKKIGGQKPRRIQMMRSSH